MKRTNNTQKYYEAARQEALIFVEAEARKILKKRKNLKEFIMAMGTYFFVDKHGNTIDTWESKYINYECRMFNASPSFKKLNDFISEWDEYLKLTGESMRFTSDGIKITNW